jgi:anti-sigma B factor antagonist
MPESGLSFDWERRGDTAQLVVDGELDTGTATVLTDRAAELLDGGPVELVVDMSGVTFCDSAGITALFAVCGRAEERGAAFVLRNLNASVYRALDATPSTREFKINEARRD